MSRDRLTNRIASYRDNNPIVHMGKFLALILRHSPETIGMKLDPNGWADVSELLEKCKKHGKNLDFETLKKIVDTDNKKRYSFNEDFSKIRASQGHSVDVDLGYTPKEPPEILYHGTGDKSVESIQRTGLEKRGRNHVHLSKDIGTAAMVGKRHGSPAIFEVASGQMYKDGFKFFLSDNSVWLTEEVPSKYLKLIP